MRAEQPNKVVVYYEGGRGAERKVWAERPDGSIIHYTGERGAERKVRKQQPDGSVKNYAHALTTGTAQCAWEREEAEAKQFLDLHGRQSPMDMTLAGTCELTPPEEVWEKEVLATPPCDQFLVGYYESVRGEEQPNGCVTPYAGEKGAVRSNGKQHKAEGLGLGFVLGKLYKAEERAAQCGKPDILRALTIGTMPNPGAQRCERKEEEAKLFLVLRERQTHVDAKLAGADDDMSV